MKIQYDHGVQVWRGLVYDLYSSLNLSKNMTHGNLQFGCIVLGRQYFFDNLFKLSTNVNVCVFAVCKMVPQDDDYREQAEVWAGGSDGLRQLYFLEKGCPLGVLLEEDRVICAGHSRVERAQTLRRVLLKVQGLSYLQRG